ncbi:MAG: hypothetical protein AAFU80_08190 [Pseudomonadota bacterium]
MPRRSRDDILSGLCPPRAASSPDAIDVPAPDPVRDGAHRAPAAMASAMASARAGPDTLCRDLVDIAASRPAAP